MHNYKVKYLEANNDLVSYIKMAFKINEIELNDEMNKYIYISFINVLKNELKYKMKANIEDVRKVIVKSPHPKGFKYALLNLTIYFRLYFVLNQVFNR
jgi:hypothetical protein